jgi:hypothetical protein
MTLPTIDWARYLGVGLGEIGKWEAPCGASEARLLRPPCAFSVAETRVNRAEYSEPFLCKEKWHEIMRQHSQSYTISND